MGTGAKIAIGIGVLGRVWISFPIARRLKAGCPLFAGTNNDPGVIRKPGEPSCGTLTPGQLLFGPIVIGK